MPFSLTARTDLGSLPSAAVNQISLPSGAAHRIGGGCRIVIQVVAKYISENEDNSDNDNRSGGEQFVAKLGVRFFAGLNSAVATEGIIPREPVRSVLAAAGSYSRSSFVNQIEWGFSGAAEASETCRTDNLTYSFLSGLSA